MKGSVGDSLSVHPCRIVGRKLFIPLLAINSSFLGLPSFKWGWWNVNVVIRLSIVDLKVKIAGALTMAVFALSHVCLYYRLGF